MRTGLDRSRDPASQNAADAAAEAAGAVTQAGPVDAPSLRSLGTECVRRGEIRKGIELLERAVALKPSNPGYHVDLSNAYRQAGEFDRAAGCCRTALMLRPEFPAALLAHGLALHKLGRPAEAADQYRRALAQRPEMALAHNHLGLALRDLGQDDEAVKHLQRAVERAPAGFLLRRNLASALMGRDRAEEAIPHIHEAIRIRPGLAMLHDLLGDALRRLERFSEARIAYLEAIRLNPNLPRAHARVGMTLRREGRLNDALPWYKTAVELRPKDRTFWEQLAGLHAERDEPEEAVTCWRRALEVSAKARASTHVGLGIALQDMGRLPEAREQFEIAARLEPDLASAHHHLGVIYEQMGEMAEAEAAFRTALRLEPDFVMPLSRLTTMLSDRLPDPDLAALETRLADPKLRKKPRARLTFALAHVLDARGDYARAAECLRRANAATREMAQGYRAYDPSDYERLIDGLIRGFTPEFFARTPGAGLETRRPVFIVGLPRSGTTLIEQVLASHPQIHGAGELRLARQSFDAIPEILARPGPPVECIAHLTAPAIRSLAERHLARLHELDGGRGDRIVDKMPDNYQHLGLLATLFPSAVFIHCRRDLRDVAVSCWMTDFTSIRWASHPADIASRFRQYRRLMAHWQSVLPVPLLNVDYEETVSDLEGVARRLLGACGLEWDPACLEFYRTRRPVRTASIAQVRQPVYKRSVARWKNYERDLVDLFSALPGEPTAPPAEDGEGAHPDAGS